MKNHRRKTNTVYVGKIPMGSDHPVRIQSMANTQTCDIAGSIAQCEALIHAGADYIRFTVPSSSDVQCLRQIRQELRSRGHETPLIADVHFNPGIALQVAPFVDKVRINPGNYGRSGRMAGGSVIDDAQAALANEFRQLLSICRHHHTALRIGVNHGSLAEHILQEYGDTPFGMAESAMEFLRICRDDQFDQVVVSMKSSNVRVMIQATREITERMEAEGMAYPVHLGVTEAGEGEDGRIRSATGIGALLAMGIGDTIRVSLTEDPVEEIPVARNLVAHILRVNEADPFSGAASKFMEDPKIQVDGITGAKGIPVVVCELTETVTDGSQVLNHAGWQHDPANQTWKFDDMAADYVFAPDAGTVSGMPEDRRILLPAAQWNRQLPPNIMPVFTAAEYLEDREWPEGRYAVSATAADLTDLLLERMAADPQAMLIYSFTRLNTQEEMQLLLSRMASTQCALPVILKKEYHEQDAGEFQIKSAADFGGILTAGAGYGLWLTNTGGMPIRDVLSTSYSILQATRRRISKTEYIACPSCGRTHFNLLATLAAIRKRTAHLKGLKIGVMGCIVNGPGEMADADYGFVGSGAGKITLYKGKQVVKRSIPEQHAVEELVTLLKQSGDWKDPGVF